jgi:hypothetical protein
MRTRTILTLGCLTLAATACSLLVDTTDLAGGTKGDAGTATDAPTESGTTVPEAGSDGAADTGADSAVDASTDAALNAGPTGCEPSDPLAEGPSLITELNEANFQDRGGRITPDGKYLLFARSQPASLGDPSSNIYIAERIAGAWGTPRKLTQLDGVDPDGGRTNEGSPMFVPGPTPRIIFSSDRRVPEPDGGSFFSNADFYFANVKASDFSQIDPPQRIAQTNPVSWHAGGLEGDAFLVPSANGDGTGRAFFFGYVANNHADLFYLEYDNTMLGTPRQPVTAVNLPAQALEYSPAFGNGFLYFTSTRVPLPDGGPDILPDGAVNSGRGQVWASKALTSTPPTFGPPVLVSDLNSAAGNTGVTWVSPDGCDLILASDRPGASGPAGTFHLYTAKRKAKRP